MSAGLIAGAPIASTAFVLVRGNDSTAAVLVEKSFPADPGSARIVLPLSTRVYEGIGFGWGYETFGAANLSRNLLELFVAPAEAERLRIDFAVEFLIGLKYTGGRIEADTVRTWLADRWERDRTEYPRGHE